ncbi:Phosphoserine aminotransferase [Vanrija pseudolonga]|uniref:phosphoserine transaminase n=1 Tax=Vanrija pseudolonga TaxID=143232 RepID=A0AAF0YJJ1_9TREE|nr:Phosphoserine aminotransferase [Vanrija pseudolonga]
MSLARDQIHNFAAGPSPLPQPVLEKAAVGLLNYDGTGIGVCELSHRGKEFKGIIEGAEANLRKLLEIPDNYAVLFSQGGGTTQFSSVFLNLLAYRRLKHASDANYAPPTIDYVVTGSWSSKAYQEAERLSIPPAPGAKPFAEPRIAATTKPAKFTTLPKADEYNFSPEAAYVYYCENETINGVEFPPAGSQSPYAFPFDRVPEGVPIVADYSSSFLSRPIPQIERHAIIYAGAQKNLGPPGVTIVIVRKDLLVDTTEAMKLGGVPAVPIQSEFKTLADNKSLYNTPPVFSIYVSALVLEYLLAERGGIAGIAETNSAKGDALYSALDEAEAKGKLRVVVKEKDARSLMNITFVIEGDREKEFLEGAEARGFRQLKGHRSVGGIRASLYNAVTLDSVKALAEYIKSF